MTVRVDGFEPILDALRSSADEYFGDPAADLRPASRLERPFSSLLRVQVRTRPREFHIFLKVFKPRSGTPDDLAQLRRWVEREFTAAARLHAAVAQRAGLTAVRPIALFPDRLALVTEEASGTPFDSLIRRAQWGRHVAAPPADVAFRVGAWIRAYQEVTDSDGILSLSERREYLDTRLRKLLEADVVSASDRASALERFDALAGVLDAARLPLVGIHADLCPPNILVDDGGGVTVLDFAMAKTGAALHDLSHLFLHLEFQRWRPRPRRRLLADAQRQLLAGYRAGLEPQDPLFQLLLLQHVVCHIALLTEQAQGAAAPVRLSLARRRWRQCGEIEAAVASSR